MDSIQPVATQIQPPDINKGLGTLSSILGIRQQQQQLQTGAAVLQQQQAGAQQQQEMMSERQKLQAAVQSGAFGDPNADDFGTKLADWARGNLPLIGNDVAQNALTTQRSKVGLRSEVADLQQKYRVGLGGIISSFVGKPAKSDQIDDAIDEYVSQNPDATGAAYHAKDLIDHLDKAQDQGTRDTALNHLAAEFQGVPQVKPAQMDQGGKIQPGEQPTFGAGFTPVGGAVKKSLPPQVVTPPGGIPEVAGGESGGIRQQFPGPAPTDADMANFNKYEGNLYDRVRTGSKSLPMLKVAQEALDKIQSGAGTQTYAGIATKLQALNAPQSLVDAVAKGNLSQVQVAEKTLFQSALGNLVSSGGASTNDQVQRALTILPNVGTDPRAAKEMLQLLAEQNQTDYAELEGLNKARKAGTFNPATWEGDWQQQLRSGKAAGVPASQVPATGKLTSKAMPSAAKLEAYAKAHFGGDTAKAKAFLASKGYE